MKRFICIIIVMLCGSLGFAQKGKNLQWIVLPQFENVRNFSEGMAAVQLNGKWGFIDNEGKVIVEPQYDDVGDFHDGMAFVKIDDKYGFIDKEGVVKIPPQFTGVFDFSEGLAAVSKDRRYYGYINKEGKVIVPFEYDFPNYCREGMIPVWKGVKAGYVNSEGVMVIPLIYTSTYEFSEGLAAVVKDKKMGYINKQGEFVIPLRFDQDLYFVGDFKEGMASILSKKDKGNYKYGFINKQGDIIVDPIYEHTLRFSEGMANVKKNDKWGYVNKQGILVIEPKFKYSSNFKEGCAPVTEDGKKAGYIDYNGNWIISPQFDEAYEFNEGIARVIVDGNVGYIDKSGRYVIQPTIYRYGASDFVEGAAAIFSQVKIGKEYKSGWGFIKNPLPLAKKVNSLEKAGAYVGNVKEVKSDEILIVGKDIAERVRMFEKLCIFSGDKLILLRAHFPMMTTAKCKVISGSIKQITPGMKVYKYREKDKDNQKAM
ncbi:MAG: WG repeat-containing protein [Spirochaetes bacterium]|nr:WG repeat-containing protein [Spirochaetota bacterium]